MKRILPWVLSLVLLPGTHLSAVFASEWIWPEPRPEHTEPSPVIELRIDPTEEVLRAALDQVVEAGGGRITFNARDAVIEIENQIDFYGSDLILDGEDRNLTFLYVGDSPFPTQEEGLVAWVKIFGDRNVIRNFTVARFNEGIHLRRGYDNVLENLTFPQVGEDAITINGSGDETFRAIIRNNYFENSQDKALMINNGGSALIENNRFVNTRQPVRATGRRGYYVIRNNTFVLDLSKPQHGRSSPVSDGPRFSGGADGQMVIFEGNTVVGATRGIRVYDSVEALIRNNRFVEIRDFGIHVYNAAKARIEGNTILRAGQIGVRIGGDAVVDLGGDGDMIAGSDTPGAGGNVIQVNQEAEHGTKQTVSKPDCLRPHPF